MSKKLWNSEDFLNSRGLVSCGVCLAVYGEERHNCEKMNCEMCGKENGTFASRLYQYENGETFRALVCSVCADLHDRLVSK
jgi:hypothetical protein